MREARAKGVPEMHGLLDVGRAPILEFDELAFGELVFVLDRCALDLGALKALPGREKSILGGLERFEGIGSGDRPGFQFPYDERQFTVKLGNLCPPGEGGLAGVFASLAAMDDAFAADKFSGKGDNAKRRWAALIRNADSRFSANTTPSSNRWRKQSLRLRP